MRIGYTEPVADVLFRESDLRAAFGRILKAGPLMESVRLVQARLGSTGRAMLQGGILRDAALQLVLGRDVRSHDVDFVVFGVPSEEDLRRCFSRDSARSNTFGGVKLTYSGLSIDIWRAELQLRCAASSAPEADIHSLLNCVTLTPDAVLFDPVSGELAEAGFLDALNHREMRLGRDSRWVRPWAAYHLAHLAHVYEKTGFRLHDEILERVRAVAADDLVEEARAYLARKGRPRASGLVDELVSMAASAA